MTQRVAINGFGRIGRSVLRAWLGHPSAWSSIDLVAINEIADPETVLHLARYDSTHGRFPTALSGTANSLSFFDRTVRLLREADVAGLPWEALGVDVVLECTGAFDDRDTAARHIAAGAQRVLFSQPAQPDVDATIVFGLNHKVLKSTDTVVSAASCTTNCIVPILSLLDQKLGIHNGVTTTIHSAMNDQPVIDSYHQTDLRLTRSALHSIIPVDTGLSRGIDRLLPNLAGRFECLHIRVPTINVSAMDMSINVKTATSVDEVNEILRLAANGQYKNLLGYTDEPHASVDFNHDPRSSIVDGTQTRVSDGTLIKLMSWFDNEWGFANRMLDVADYWLSLKP